MKKKKEEEEDEEEGVEGVGEREGEDDDNSKLKTMIFLGPGREWRFQGKPETWRWKTSACLEEKLLEP